MRFAPQLCARPCLNSTSRMQQKTGPVCGRCKAQNLHVRPARSEPDRRETQLAARGIKKKPQPKGPGRQGNTGHKHRPAYSPAWLQRRKPCCAHCGYIRINLFLQNITGIKLRYALLFPQSARRLGPPERPGPYAREKHRWRAQVRACAAGEHASPALLRAGVYVPSHPDRLSP